MILAFVSLITEIRISNISLFLIYAEKLFFIKFESGWICDG